MSHAAKATALSSARSGRGLFALALSIAAMLAGGCASPGTIDASTPPDDFVLGVTVYAKPSESPLAGRDDASLPRALRPGRYIIEADGVLRAATGAAAQPTVFPARTRQLSAAQLDEVWQLTRDAGVFAAPSMSASTDQAAESEAPPAFGTIRVGSPVLYDPPLGHISALIEAFAAGQRGTRAFILDDQTQAALAAQALTDHLAELAWVPPSPVDVERALRARQPAGR